MENVNVEFNIKLNKKIYEENNYKTRNDFFSQSVLMNVASDYIFILNLLENKDNKEKEKYSNYLETLKNIKRFFYQTSATLVPLKFKYKNISFLKNKTKIKIVN